MDLSIFGVTLVSLTKEEDWWELQVLFLTLGYHGGSHYISMGGPMWVYLDTQPTIGVCLGDDEGGHKIQGMPAVLVILGGLLIGQLRWWSVLMGLTFWWLAGYTLEEE